MPLVRRCRTERSFSWATFASALLITQALQCDHEDERGLPETIFEGSASDEAYERLLDKLPSAQVSATSAIVITSPTSGSEIPSTPPPTLGWHLPTASLSRPPKDPPGPPGELERTTAIERSARDDEYAGPGDGAPRAQSSRRGSSAAPWALRSAEAHLPPVTGHVFYLELRSSSREEDTVRLLTTETSWTIDETSWRKLRQPNGPVRIKAYNAYLNRNVVEEGPFTPPDVTDFTIAGGP